MAHQVGWLMRSGSWMLPAAARSLTACAAEGSALHQAASALSCSLRAESGIQRLASKGSCGSTTRTYSTPSTSAAAESSSAPEAPTAKRSGFGSWLRTFLPGGKELASADTKALAGASTKDADKDNAAAESDDIKELKELRNMDMSGYVEYCKKMRSGTTTPRPRCPPVSRRHPDYLRFQDTRRIAYLRLQQHERIGSLVTKEESARILAEKEEVIKDRKLLQAIADRTGVYIDLEVKDCIEQFLQTRKRAERMHRYVTEFGHPPPNTAEEQDAADKFMKRQEAHEEVAQALAARDAGACPLPQGQPWAGAHAVCSLTKLPYWQCCGALGAQAGLKPPAGVVHQERQGKEAVLEQEMKRQAYKKFGGRAEGRLRRAFIITGKPRFRDY